MKTSLTSYEKIILDTLDVDNYKKSLLITYHNKKL